MNKIITKTILLLSFVSLFTDISSEMLYPIMPLFLSSIGFSALYIGVLEGIAEAVAGFGKGYFGKMSDNMGKRVPFVRAGYFLSSISKPMMVLILNPFWILFARVADRMGKGIRTGARDAILSSETTPELKGRVFGFHRAFDTIGAAIGPIIALIYLEFCPKEYKPLFLLAFIPAILSVGLTFILKEKSVSKPIKTKSNTGFFSFLKYWKSASKDYKKLVTALLIFTAVNSSDMFLLLIAKNHGLPDTYIIGTYIFYNLIYALFSYPFGVLGDKIGLKYSLAIGLFLFSITYLLIAFSYGIVPFFIIFFIYGLYAAATEGISKAWISNLAEQKDTATAIGFFSGWQSICTLAASSLAGLIWTLFGAEVTFIVSSVVAFIIGVYILFSFKTQEKIISV